MHSSEEKEIPAYSVHINTSAFSYKKCHLKQRTQTEWLGYFWRKCGMDQKRISPSCEDRLSELTTGQIDRIIDMERIRTILHDKKRKKEEVYFNYHQQPNTHPNVYQANFLAKINAIAIRRNIRHQKSQGFDEYFGEQLQKASGQKDKKTTQLPYKYLKKYQHDSKRPRNFKAANIEEEDQKSIDSIEDKLQDFEQKLQQSRVERSRKDKQKQPQCSAMRWFNGMSNHYLRKDEPQGSTLGDFQRMPSFDIESQVRQSRKRTSSLLRGKTEPSQRINRSEPFVKFKINRVNRVISVK